MLSNDHIADSTGISLGTRIREHRQSLGFSLDEVSRRAHIARVLVEALEEGRYGDFSAKVYALGALRRLIVYVFPVESDDWIQQMHTEWDTRQRRLPETNMSRPMSYGNNFYITPSRCFAVAGAAAMILFLFFMGLQIRAFVGFPVLVVEEPIEGAALNSPVVTLRGFIGRESQLTINGREVTIDGHGNFNQEVELVSGINTLEFMVRNRFDRTSKIVRHVVVK